MDALNQLRLLLEDPSHWTKGAYARDKEGAPVREGDYDATCLCLIGACHKVTVCIPDYFQLTEALSRAGGIRPFDIVDFNDREDTTHSDVLALIDKAIAEQGATS